MARLTHNYTGLADRTVPPVTGRLKARRKSDWAWRPYARQATCGPVTITRTTATGVTREVVGVGKPKRERREREALALMR